MILVGYLVLTSPVSLMLSLMTCNTPKAIERLHYFSSRAEELGLHEQAKREFLTRR